MGARMAEEKDAIVDDAIGAGKVGRVKMPAALVTRVLGGEAVV